MGGSRGRGYVCMYVRGGCESRKRSNGSGTERRERPEERHKGEGGLLTIQQIVSAAARRQTVRGESRERRELGPSEEDRGKSCLVSPRSWTDIF